MLLIILTFLFTTALYGTLLCLACRRVLHHLQGNEEGIKAVTQFVLLPLLGRKPEDESRAPASEPETP